MPIDKKLLRDLLVISPFILLAIALFFFLFLAGELVMFLVETAVFGGVGLALYYVLGERVW